MNTDVGCHVLLQGIFPIQVLNPHLISPALACKFFTTSATWEALLISYMWVLGIEGHATSGAESDSSASHHDRLWAREVKEGRVQRERNKTQIGKKKKKKNGHKESTRGNGEIEELWSQKTSHILVWVVDKAFFFLLLWFSLNPLYCCLHFNTCCCFF